MAPGYVKLVVTKCLSGVAGDYRKQFVTHMRSRRAASAGFSTALLSSFGSSALRPSSMCSVSMYALHITAFPKGHDAKLLYVLALIHCNGFVGNF